MMIAALFIATLAVAFLRVAMAQQKVAREIADAAAVDKRFRRAAKPVRVVGKAGVMVALGVGAQAGETFELQALAFSIVTEAGETIAIAAGAKLRAIVALDTARFTGNVLRVPAGTPLLARMPPLVRDDGDPVAHVLEVMRGEPVTLLDPAVDLFAFTRRTRIASWPRILGLAGVATGILVAAYPPAIVLALAVTLVDQLALRGTVFALACTKWRDAEYWNTVRQQR